MPSMIESLIGESVRRHDDKLMTTGTKPAPVKPRDLFAIFMQLGAQASVQTLVRSCDLRDADPRVLVFAALGRWPSWAELQPHLNVDYEPRHHLRGLVTSGEFQQGLATRICEAFPERPRQLFIRVARCAGEHLLAATRSSHPVFPPSLDRASGRMRGEERGAFLSDLGRFLESFATTRTILVTRPKLAGFRNPAAQSATAPKQAEALHRPGDRLFMIVREPQSLVLSAVNALAAALAGPTEHDTAQSAEWRGRLSPAILQAGGAELAHEILAGLDIRNPICTALGHTNAQAAIDECRTANVEITDLAHYAAWLRYTWNMESEAHTLAARAALSIADLTPTELAQLRDSVAEDTAFYEKVKPIIAASPAASAMGGTL